MSNFKFIYIFSLVLMFAPFSFANEEIEASKCECFEVNINDDISLSTTINSFNIDESSVQIIYKIKL
ncbi:hypothetical protein A9Q76_03415 [Arcobacter sp. 31_11_sub10_T18]|nr:hypothetical protein A9Q76_03415 [Arcobacter sp. 31_11_sub10_T18]